MAPAMLPELMPSTHEAAAPLVDHRPTLLEAGFPFRLVSKVAQRDRLAAKDHIYRAHRWWARRPPAVIRALLIASTVSANTSADEFWDLFESGEALLPGLHVGDPFMGGATTLVEASRLGASVTGMDVDPLAVEIARQELEPFDDAKVKSAGEKLVEHLRERAGTFWSADGQTGREPLHFFWHREVECPACAAKSLMYRSLVLARDLGIAGAVVRDAKVVAFCPDCLQLHELSPARTHLVCCGRRRPLHHGTFRRARYRCPECDAGFRHDELKTATLPRVLVAIEETRSGEYRRLRRPTTQEAAGEATAIRTLRQRRLEVPVQSLAGLDEGRAAAYGFLTVRDLFSARQLLTFAEAGRWLGKAELEVNERRALTLAVSNALASNNLLCGFAPDYGRLSPLFSVRSYSMPVLSVELNPLNLNGGRGTLPNTIARVLRSHAADVQRHSINPRSRRVHRHGFVARRSGVVSHLVCQSADRSFPNDLGKLDIAVTDPPYFDYISYSDLSFFFRSWLSHLRGDAEPAAGELAGAPLFPVGANGSATFARRLGRALRHVAAALKPGGPLVFTFHSINPKAWAALGDALTFSDFAVTALFPVWADARAGGHRHDGNCEWDVVFVCRHRSGQDKRVDLAVSLDEWIQQLRPFKIAVADRSSMSLAIETALAVNSQKRKSEA